MAVTDQDPRSPYTGNGVATTFAYTFKIFEDSDLKVEVDGVIKTLNTDYIITGAGDSGGGNVVFVSAPVSGAEVLFYRDLPYDRETDYSEDLLSAIVNNDFDKAIMLIQQDRRDRTRAIKVPMSETGDQVIDDAETRAGGVLGFDETTGAMETKFIADMGVIEAGDGLQLSGEVLSVKTGEGLKIENSAVAVDPTKVLMLSGGSLSGVLNEKQVSIAAAASTNILGAAGNSILMTGNSPITITGLGTSTQAGARRHVTSTGSGAHILTHNATSLILETGANIIVAQGDGFWVEDLGSNNARVYGYHRADGTALGGGASVVIGDNRNLIIKNNASHADHQVDIIADELVLKNASGISKLVSSVNLTVDVAASGANGLDTGSEAASTFYYIWVINNGTTTAGLFSTSATSPTLPSGYTYKTLIGVVLNDSGSNFKNFYAIGRKTYLAETESVVFSNQAGVTSWSSQSLASFIPSIARTVSLRTGLSVNGSRVISVAASTTLQGASHTSGGGGGGAPSGFYGGGTHPDVPIITAQTIYWLTEDTSANYRMIVRDFTI